MELQVRALLAAAAVVGFGAIAIGVRELLQRRWTGGSGIKLHRYGVTPNERVTFACLLLAILGVAIGIALPLADTSLGGPSRVSGEVAAAGFVVALAGIALTFWAQLAMGASWRVGLDRHEHTELVTGGPYRWVRNPIYTAMLVFVTGLVVLVPNVATAIALASTLAGIEIAVRAVEEPFLLAEHGDQYRAWMKTSGRFIPRVG